MKAQTQILAAFCFLTLLLAPGLGADSFSESVRSEAERLKPQCRELLAELLEKSGDFGGYGSAAWDLLESLEPSATAMSSQMEADLRAELDPETIASAEAFWATDAGRKLVWLNREAKTQEGRRSLARSGRAIAERFSPERLELIQRLDAATLESQTSIEVGRVLMGLITTIAKQVSAAVAEEAEWAEEPGDIEDWIEQSLSKQTSLELGYRTSRLSDSELQQAVDFASSPAGEAFFTARYNTSIHMAQWMVELEIPKLQKLLANELWEYQQENDDDDDDS